MLMSSETKGAVIIYLLKPYNPSVKKVSSAISVGLDQTKADTNFSYDLNGVTENESYTQENNEIDLSMAFSTNEIGAQVYATRNNYLELFRW